MERYENNCGNALETPTYSATIFTKKRGSDKTPMI